MISRRTRAFRGRFDTLPARVRQQAIEAYRRFAADPYHPSLHFKQVHPEEPVYCVRIGLHYRALGTRQGDHITSFWIGSHAEYDRLTNQF